jgi:menaquinone-9 beta-reductase
MLAKHYFATSPKRESPVASSLNMCDVLIVGAGPAGTIAGLVAARAGARVRILDRATFPRDKLCGDTINPGAIGVLRRLGISRDVEANGLRVDGMVVTGERRVRVVGRYPDGVHGRAILRRELDAILLRAAIAAGCQFDEGVTVRRAVIDHRDGRPIVRGVVGASRSGELSLRAPVVLAADGRRSALAFGLGLARHPVRPRRWAIGAYFVGIGPRGLTPGSDLGVGSRGQIPGSDPGVRSAEIGTMGEMHVRRNGYVGVAPVPGGLTNVCVVRPVAVADAEFRDPSAILRRTIADDELLRERLHGATLATPPIVLGPLAVDVTGVALDGLLVAGDAAGFVDPMTGDGLQFAIRGGELAALASLRALEHGWTGVQAGLSDARAHAFARKWRFNRVLRALVSSPRAVSAAAAGSWFVPAAVRAVIARAGDCDLAA